MKLESKWMDFEGSIFPQVDRNLCEIQNCSKKKRYSDTGETKFKNLGEKYEPKQVYEERKDHNLLDNRRLIRRVQILPVTIELHLETICYVSKDSILIGVISNDFVYSESYEESVAEGY